MTAEKIIEILGLKPHREGGFFRETYRAAESVAQEALPERYRGLRSMSTSIYFLLTPESFSATHRLASDELCHFYLGDRVEMLLLETEGRGRIVMLGSDIEAGIFPRVAVPRGTWQGSRLVKGGRFALLGTTVSPGFEFEDFEIGRKEELVRLYLSTVPRKFGTSLVARACMRSRIACAPAAPDQGVSRPAIAGAPRRGRARGRKPRGGSQAHPQ